MKELTKRFVAVMFDLRLIVGVVGFALSVVLHELFHVIVHWGDIEAINIFPDSQAIVEVLFVPSGDYDLIVEEALAYMITMITMVLTAKLIAEIHDVRDEKSLEQAIFGNNTENKSQELYDLKSMEHLGKLLGVAPNDLVTGLEQTEK